MIPVPEDPKPVLPLGAIRPSNDKHQKLEVTFDGCLYMPVEKLVTPAEAALLMGYPQTDWLLMSHIHAACMSFDGKSPAPIIIRPDERFRLRERMAYGFYGFVADSTSGTWCALRAREEDEDV